MCLCALILYKKCHRFVESSTAICEKLLHNLGTLLIKHGYLDERQGTDSIFILPSWFAKAEKDYAIDTLGFKATYEG
jgi:hypothetical protein